MVGSVGAEAAAGKTKNQGASGQDPEQLAGLERFHAALEKLHMAEAELARVRVDLARKGVNLNVSDDLHW